ncbi:AAA family ATPase [Microbacterium sp. BWT-B31]|uniref:helix-turn-helix transcriptional regulator n=1 Tax=Microbacterium sp. BWT-B31 TaxID=3232072 RepID=UPI0035287E5B
MPSHGPENPARTGLVGDGGSVYVGGIDVEPSPILGRDEELGRLHALIAGARNGTAGALLVVGDPGIGKSMLLGEAAKFAAHCRVLELTGFEVESDFAYGGLQRLGRVLDAQTDQLPAHHRSALLVAAGLREGPPPKRALVALAALSLLSSASEVAPLVVLVDDAHHLDPESLGVLGFVARRLSAEAVAVIFAAREEEPVTAALAGVPVQRLAGLELPAAEALLTRLAGAPLDPAVVSALTASTGGNPLALTELALESDPQRLTLAAIAQSPAPIGGRLEEHYTARVRRLSPDARTWLLVAAAESSGDASVVRAAAAKLGLAADASAELERNRLVEIRDTVRFRHPMVRSAVYNSAPDVERREVHAILRVETAARGLPEFSAWHAAAASAGTDADLASELVELADRAATRGGLSSRASLLARAAGLSPDPAVRDELIVAASEAAIASGAARLALELLATVDVEGLTAVTRGRYLFTRAISGLFLGDTPALLTGAATLVEAADSFGSIAPEAQQRALMHALNFVQSAEHRSASISMTELGLRFRAGADAADGTYAVMLRALAAFILDPYEVALPHLEAAATMLEGLDDALLLEFSFCTVSPTVGLWDPDAAARLLSRTARVARELGAVREADAVLWVLSAVELTRGDPAQASSYMEQAAQLRRAVGYADEQVVNAALLPWQGAPDEAVLPIADALAAAGWHGVWRMAAAAVGIGQLADGRFEDAYATLRPLVAQPFLQASFHQLGEFVEAAVKTGRRDEAEATAGEIHRLAQVNRRPWLLGIDERCRALLSDDETAQAHYEASLAALDTTEVIGDRARARLMYGEWLRRQRRRRDARDQLHAALTLFEQTGAMRFAARARRELAALGESPAMIAQPAIALTSQEAVIARLAADGATNAEIGASLFISRNTVDYHLRKIFRKLGVNSRRQLADAVRTPAGETA